MEKTAKEVAELRDRHNNVAMQLANLRLTAHKNIDKAVELFGVNATDLENIFTQACTMLFTTAENLDKKLKNTIIEL